MPKLTIDGQEIEVVPGTSVIQACEQMGIEIPRFCYHDKLSVAANCRMCLVEQEKAPKPVASCAVACADGMVIKTNTEVVKKARKGVMEMLLINHPLDCPICDQGGECDLQDQAVAYGFDRTRYAEAKRAVKDKELGPLVKTVMTRCIHCTRCVRFMDEVAGTTELGSPGRGEDVEIGTYVQHTLLSELSGNIVDICPVGALTHKPYAFTARPWELKSVETVDALDGVGSNITLSVRGNEVMRIMPRLNEDINEEWLADKSRYAVDGLKRQRLDTPYIRENGKLRKASWDEALNAAAQLLATSKVAAVAGDMADAETMFLLKQLLPGAMLECRQEGSVYDVSQPAYWRMNTGIVGIEAADALLLVGVNPRHEAPLVNARIRKAWRKSGLKVGVIGEKRDLTYPYHYIGAGPASLGQLGSFGEVLKNAQRPMIIVGAAAFARFDGPALQAATHRLAEQLGVVKEGWNGYNVLQPAAARGAGLALGFVNPGGLKAVLDAARTGMVQVVYNLGADEIDPKAFGETAYVIYQGHHGDAGAERADIILPSAAYTEKQAIFVNTEGRAQSTRQAVFAPGEAREDWKIVRELSARMNRTLPYDDLGAVRAGLASANPVFARLGAVVGASWPGAARASGGISEAPFTSHVTNYYLTDPICRASPTMAKCAAEIWPRATGQLTAQRTGSHG